MKSFKQAKEHILIIDMFLILQNRQKKIKQALKSEKFFPFDTNEHFSPTDIGHPKWKTATFFKKLTWIIQMEMRSKSSYSDCKAKLLGRISSIIYWRFNREKQICCLAWSPKSTVVSSLNIFPSKRISYDNTKEMEQQCQKWQNFVISSSQLNRYRE